MDSRRIRNLRNNFDRNNLDKQVDRIFQTGRQFVDGVSGARPGKRKNSDFQGITRRNVKNVGRWVSDKMDLFFDEEEDWYDEDNIYEDTKEIKSFTRESKSTDVSQPFLKRPLEALSLRQPKNIQTNQQKKLPYSQLNSSDEWPDNMDLKLDRWQRSSEKDIDIVKDQYTQRSSLSKARKLPRSRRRRA